MLVDSLLPCASRRTVPKEPALLERGARGNAPNHYAREAMEMTRTISRLGLRARLLAAILITAFMALAMIQVTSAAPNDNSNGTGGTPEIVAAIDSLAEQLAEFQLDATERFDTIDATLLALED